MGKTEKGAVWLDATKTPSYDFYQYWRNIDDADVVKCMKLLTFTPMDEIKEYEKLQGQELNSIKALLAYRITELVHGKEEAEKVHSAAKAIFSQGTDDPNMPTSEISTAALSEGKNIVDLLYECRIVPSKGEGRRLIEQGGVYMNDVRIESIDRAVTRNDFKDNKAIIRRGKKHYQRILLTD
jgi:tyrosyl-tRNA synthetase